MRRGLGGGGGAGANSVLVSVVEPPMITYEPMHGGGRLVVFDNGQDRVSWRVVTLVLAILGALLVGHQLTMASASLRCVSPA